MASLDFYGFKKIGKKKFLYHPCSVISSRAYITSDKQRDQIANLWGHIIMLLPMGLVFFPKKHRSISHVIYYVGAAYYVACILYVAIRLKIILRGCEKVRRNKLGIFYHAKRGTATRSKGEMLFSLITLLGFVLIEVILTYIYSYSLVIWLLIAMLMVGLIICLHGTICYKMVIFKIDYLRKLRRNECVDDYSYY